MTTRWDRAELEDLVAGLAAADPAAPTLCEGWQARHLAAHLHLRRHKPWSVMREGPGSALAAEADAAASPARYRDLVLDFARAPRTATPMALQDGPLGMAVNLVEYVVHHEDLRRGAGPVPARTLPPEMSDALFDRVAMLGRLGLRRAEVGVVLVVPGGRRKVVRRGADAVAVVGGPVELALVATGRLRAADVELKGSDDAVASFRRTIT